jgi:hypothetical protein
MNKEVWQEHLNKQTAWNTEVWMGGLHCKGFLKIQDGRTGVDSSGPGHRPIMANYEHGNKSSGSTEGREFLS